MGAQRPVRCGTAIAVLALVLSACGSGGEAEDRTGKGGTSGKRAPASAHRPKGFPAPLRFSRTRAIALPDSAGAGKVAIAGVRLPLPVALHKGVAFIARPDGLEVFDGLKASKSALIRPEHVPVTRLEDLGGLIGDNPAEAPLITSEGSTTWALNALVTEVRGSGTSKGHDVVELMATDTARAVKSWFVEIKLAEEDDFGDDRDEAHVIGRSGDTVIVFARGKIFGVSLKSHKQAWAADGWYRTGAVVAGNTVVAITGEEGRDDQVVGLNGASGRQVWQSPRESADPSPSGLDVAGPDSVMTSEYAHNADERNYLLEAATGKVRRMLPAGSPGSDCAYDGLSATVCSGSRLEKALAAYDPKSGKELWKLPDEPASRVAPKVTLVRQGLIYGTTSNGPVVLDAGTGKDKEDAPGIAPYVLDNYVGITETQEDTGLTAYRTVG